MRYLKAVVVAAGLSAAPAWASQADEQQPVRSGEPVPLTDSELEEVTAGALINISLVNSPINLALVFQINIGGTATQTANVQVIQVVMPSTWSWSRRRR